MPYKDIMILIVEALGLVWSVSDGGVGRLYLNVLNNVTRGPSYRIIMTFNSDSPRQRRRLYAGPSRREAARDRLP